LRIVFVETDQHIIGKPFAVGDQPALHIVEWGEVALDPDSKSMSYNRKFSLTSLSRTYMRWRLSCAHRYPWIPRPTSRATGRLLPVPTSSTNTLSTPSSGAT
jgi:hypothetical protein